jgi:hypothetical protein
VLSALFGASLVYGSVERRTAPGQLALADLLETYAVDRPRPIEALFGIVGTDVSDSLSPFLHNALFRSRDLPFLPAPASRGLRPLSHRARVRFASEASP